MNVLEKICADKLGHVAVKKEYRSLDDLKNIIKNSPQPRGFIKALQNKNGTALITEVKKASPSKGIIRKDFDPVKIAKIYEDNGAACLSVLTDEKYFMGHDEYFTAIRKHVSLPMLRKDFMVDPYQIYESRALGADCVLIIMACLDDNQAKELYGLSTALGMDVLVEVHDAEELDRALLLTPAMVGVNNRNLKTLNVDLQTGFDLAKKMPGNILKVAESGIDSKAAIEKFMGVGYNAFLIGESLMREKDIAIAVQNML